MADTDWKVISRATVIRDFTDGENIKTLVEGLTQADVERALKDGFIPIRDEQGKLLFRYQPSENLIEIQRRNKVTIVDLNKYQLSAKSAAIQGGANGRFSDE